MSKSSKGGEFERDIAKRLSEWWADREDVFWRTAGSGARATVRGKAGKQTAGQSGDICATDPIGQPLIDLITIECKRGYPKAIIHDAIDRVKTTVPGEFEQFIRAAIDTHITAGSYAWMLITRRNQKIEMVWFPMNLYLDLRVWDCFTDRPTPFMAVSMNIRPRPKVGGKLLRRVRYVGMPLSIFLKEVQRKDIEALWRLWRLKCT